MIIDNGIVDSMDTFVLIKRINENEIMKDYSHDISLELTANIIDRL